MLTGTNLFTGPGTLKETSPPTLFLTITLQFKKKRFSKRCRYSLCKYANDELQKLKQVVQEQPVFMLKHSK